MSKLRMSVKAKDLGQLAIYAGLALGVGMCNVDHLNRDTYQVKVVGTETKRDDKKDRYLVFTTNLATNKEYVFQNVDSTLEFKWNSSDLQAKLKEAQQHDKTCEIRAYGFRMLLFSSYKNIVDVTCK